MAQIPIVGGTCGIGRKLAVPPTATLMLGDVARVTPADRRQVLVKLVRGCHERYAAEPYVSRSRW